MEEQVVLVDVDDNVLGLMGKQQAHVAGLLHRAFSIFIFNEKGEMLLQKRADHKYHSPGQWTNAVCSHPRIDETYKEAAERRLSEELNITTQLQPKFHFIYKADVGNGLWEHELDHVFVAEWSSNDSIQPNPEEVSEVRFISLNNLDPELMDHPEHFTEWFKIILKEYKEHLNN